MCINGTVQPDYFWNSDTGLIDNVSLIEILQSNMTNNSNSSYIDPSSSNIPINTSSN